MDEVIPSLLATAAMLGRQGRTPTAPFRIALEDGTELRIERLLRILPGKRIVGEGNWKGRRVLAKLFISTDSAQHAARETQGVQAMQAAALPTPKLLLSSRLHAGGHAVLSEFLIDAKSLADEWETLQHLPSGHVLQEQCLQSAFALLGQMHAAGVCSRARRRAPRDRTATLMAYRADRCSTGSGT